MRHVMTLGLAAGAALTLALRPLAAQTGGEGAQAPTNAAPAGTTRYTLVEVNGRPLPVETEQERRCRESVTSATLTLEAGGRWRLEETQRETCGGQTREDDRDSEDGTYRTEGSTIRFFDDDGDEPQAGNDRDIDLDELRTGTLGADGSLTVELADGKHRLLFRPETQ